MDELQANMLKVKEHMRAKGFRPPAASDWRVICVWDLQSRACNSANLQAYLVTCEQCPDKIKSKFMANVATGKTAEKRISKAAMESIGAVAEEQRAPCAPSAKRAEPADDIRSFSERKLTADEIRKVDERLTRFCYSEGLSFKALGNAKLRGALRKLNSSWADGTRLSDWTLRHHFLDDEYERVSGEVAEKIVAALFVTLISDGWSGVQKRHVLNLILATPEPAFKGNVETKEDSVTGEYQAKLFAETIEANGGIAKVPAVCTDNTSVMSKAWRLLRAKFHGLFTYGCAPQSFQLHAKDICGVEQLSGLSTKMSIVYNYFSTHLQAGGRAMLSRLQLEIYGKESALI